MISMIMACDNKGGIGYECKLPWPRNEIDMRWYRERTKNAALIVGYNTFFSLPIGAYRGRQTIILVDSSRDYKFPKKLRKNVHTWDARPDFNEDIEYLLYSYLISAKEKIIIGGAKTYQLCIPYIERIYLTKFNGEFWCDTYFDVYEAFGDKDLHIKSIYKDDDLSIIQIDILKR